MNPVTDAKEDPLIAALPPATDYLTYLTLLEYQLKPNNLSTLNRLLSEDDGTLAAEIGWDLLKLVLPMLQIVPEDANRCLGIIARRGNPREVVVRVAEELESLGQYEEEREDEGGEEGEEEEEGLDRDGLPTFAGEAPRIHLGEMKLDGMPPPSESETQTEPVEAARSDRNVSPSGESGSDDVLILQALLAMLSILHPRIKTQFPSRFLATSLPAALSAYRRLRVTTDTTSAFVDFLAKLSGKQRPALPPRMSTASSIPRSTSQPVSAPAPSTSTQAPPLPDPEAKIDRSSTNVEHQDSEKAIIERLLQAVMLEVLDEYTASFQKSDQPSMSWTIRLREKHEPKRVLPGRPTETQRWTQSAELRPRDEVVVKFLKLSKDLNLNPAQEISTLTNSVSGKGIEPTEQPEFDYPTSPSQIPFPTSGLILLFAAQNFAQDTTGLTGTPPLPMSAIHSLFQATFAPTQDLPHPPSLSQTDALLSLIYTTLQSPLSQPTPQTTTTTTTTATADSPPASSTIDLPFLTNLTNLFTTSPDPFVRDSTHHLTTLLLHNHTTPEIKLLYIKSLLSPHQSPASPIHDIQQGNLRALAINWLKDEFLSCHNTTADTSSSQIATNSDVPIHPPTAGLASSPTNPGLNPNIMHTDPDLISLIFPQLPSTPGPFITGQPGTSATSSTAGPDSASMSTETDLESLLLQIPSYIAALNLICILASLPSSQMAQDHESVLSTNAAADASATTTPLFQTVLHFILATTQWKDLLLGLAAGIAQNQAHNGGESGPVDVADIYALDDAVGRATAAAEHLID